MCVLIIAISISLPLDFLKVEPTTFCSTLLFNLFYVKPIRAVLVRVVEVEFGSLEVADLNSSNRDRFTRQRSVRIPAKEWTTVANDSRTIIPNEAISNRSRIHIN